MPTTQSRSSGLFSGLVLISVGALLLLHNYGHLELGRFFSHWWPLLIIFWGAVKLYERTAGRRFGRGDGGAITSGEVALVVGMLALLGIVVAVDYTKEKAGTLFDGDMPGESYTFDIDLPPQAIPPNGHVSVKLGHGDITVRPSDDAQLRVTAKKNIRTWSEAEANRLEKPVELQIVKNGDAYEVHPSGYDLSDSRIGMDVELAVPKKSALMLKTDKGDVVTSGMGADISVTNQNGDVEVRGTTGDVSIEMHKGDVKVSGTSGDVKVSGKGGEIDVVDSGGSLTVDGDFYGPVRADKVAKGVRMISPKTDLTVSSLAGHLEAGSGNMDIIDAPGNLTLRTRDVEINVENPGAKVSIDNRNAEINVRYSSAPKDDATITNSSAGISLTVPNNSNFDIEADCHNCDIESEFSGLTPAKSESGDSHLTGKLGSGRGPKITLKTSYGNISLRRTAVPMPGKLSKPPAVPAPPAPIPPAEEQ
jgi:DUF4097 and DUF4098 domain-containing protein YvlB